ncbi:MAG: hypothetical protein ACREOA_02375 [Candidatus Dormibacteria bacterium]
MAGPRAGPNAKTVRVVVGLLRQSPTPEDRPPPWARLVIIEEPPGDKSRPDRPPRLPLRP